MSLFYKIKHSIQNEIRKIQQLPRKDRGRYIWDYYRIPIIFILAYLLLISGILSIAFDKSEYALQTVIVNHLSTESVNKEPLTTAFHQHMGFSKNQKVIAVESAVTYYPDTGSFSQEGLTQIHMWVSAQQIDLLLSDRPLVNHMNELGLLTDLEAMLPNDLWEQVKPLALYSKDPETGKSIPTALDISGTVFVDACSLSITPTLLAVASNTVNSDNCIAMIRYIMDYSK